LDSRLTWAQHAQIWRKLYFKFVGMTVDTFSK
jgi:hypothetical protein